MLSDLRFAFLPLILAAISLITACSAPDRNKDDQDTPASDGDDNSENQEPVDPKFPASFFERNADSLTRIKCDSTGKTCDESTLKAVSFTKLWAATESYLGIPALRSSIDGQE